MTNSTWSLFSASFISTVNGFTNNLIYCPTLAKPWKRLSNSAFRDFITVRYCYQLQWSRRDDSSPRIFWVDTILYWRSTGWNTWNLVHSWRVSKCVAEQGGIYKGMQIKGSLYELAFVLCFMTTHICPSLILFWPLDQKLSFQEVW